MALLTGTVDRSRVATIGPRGFTLVEAIVVSIIVAVLAAVAIPMYGGYVRSSRIDMAKNNCQLIGMAIMQAHNRGVEIAQNDWNAIGMQDLSDKVWQYSFGGANPFKPEDIDANYQIKADGKDDGPMKNFRGVFKPFQPPASRWEGDFSN